MWNFGFGFWYEVVVNVLVTFGYVVKVCVNHFYCLSCPDLILNARCRGFMNFHRSNLDLQILKHFSCLFCFFS